MERSEVTGVTEVPVFKSWELVVRINVSDGVPGQMPEGGIRGRWGRGGNKCLSR